MTGKPKDKYHTFSVWKLLYSAKFLTLFLCSTPWSFNKFHCFSKLLCENLGNKSLLWEDLVVYFLPKFLSVSTLCTLYGLLSSMWLKCHKIPMYFWPWSTMLQWTCITPFATVFLTAQLPYETITMTVFWLLTFNKRKLISWFLTVFNPVFLFFWEVP